MPKQLKTSAGATSQTEYVIIEDMNGSPITGLAYNSTNLVAKYVRAGAAVSSISLVTQTVSGAWSSGGFVEVDSTNLPGLYRFDIPDAAFAAGVDKVIVGLYGYTGMRLCALEYEIGAATLATVGTGTGQISLSSGAVTVGTNNDKTGYSLSSPQTFNLTGNVTGNLSGSVGSVTGAVGSVTGNVGGNVTGSVGSVTGSVGSVVGNVGGNVTGSVGSVAGAVGSVTGNIGGNVVGSVGSVASAVSISSGQLFIKKAATQVFPFVMVNSSGTPTAGLTVTATRSIDGAAFAACTNAVSAIANGWYTITLSTTDTNGSAIGLRFTATGAADRNVTVFTQT